MFYRDLPPRGELFDRFSYCRETGRLSWRKNGKLVGGCTKGRYRRVRFKGHAYLCSRIIWYLMYGFDPKDLEIDHLNRDSLDDRVENLRLVDRSANNLNKRLYKNNSSGHRNVHVTKHGFIASFQRNGKTTRLGRFKNAADAADAVRRFKCES